MKVKELIKELKTYPKDCKVGVTMHDNSENEVAGLPIGVYFVKKEDAVRNYPDCDCVVIKC